MYNLNEIENEIGSPHTSDAPPPAPPSYASHYASQSYYASSNANSLDLALSLVHGADALTLTRIHRPNDEHGAPHTVFAPAS